MRLIPNPSLAGSFLLFTAAVAHAQQYSVTDLGTLGGASSYGSGINASGQVVGSSSKARNAAQHAFLYSNGRMQDLGTLGGVNSGATGINASGQIVGASDTKGSDSSTDHAFLYSSGVLQDLGTLGGTSSAATGINDNGQIVGNAIPGEVFLYSNGVMQDLGYLGSQEGAIAYGINNSGQIIGLLNFGFGSTLWTAAFIYSGGVVQQFGYNIFAYGINASGQVVGSTQIYSQYTTWDAFLYSNGVMQDLGTPGGATSINASGQIVGYLAFSGSSAATRAALYSNGTMIDLNTLDTADPLAQYVTLSTAQGINDSGWIVANGIDSRTGNTHAYLLTPLTAPPVVPSNLTATPGNRRVSLSWAAADSAASYNVYESTTPGGESSTPTQTGITGTTVTFKGLKDRTTYYFKVAAVNDLGTSGLSNEVSAEPSRR